MDDMIPVMGQSPHSQAIVRVPSGDGRSSDARFLRRVRDSLSNQIGGHPTAAQVTLIEQVAWLQLYLRKMNESALAKGGIQSAAHAKQYVGYSESLVRTLARLDLDIPNDLPVPIRSGIAA